MYSRNASQSPSNHLHSPLHSRLPLEKNKIAREKTKEAKVKEIDGSLHYGIPLMRIDHTITESGAGERGKENKQKRQPRREKEFNIETA